MGEEVRSISIADVGGSAWLCVDDGSPVLVKDEDRMQVVAAAEGINKLGLKGLNVLRRHVALLDPKRYVLDRSVHIGKDAIEVLRNSVRQISGGLLRQAQFLLVAASCKPSIASDQRYERKGDEGHHDMDAVQAPLLLGGHPFKGVL